MPIQVQELQQLIEQQFPGARIDIKETEGRINGPIFWSEFRGLDLFARNRLITERILDQLGLKGLNIGNLVPLAPGEKL